MSKTTKRKHVTKEVLDDYILPTDEQQIVKVVASKGNNLHEVENADQETFLVSMPTKFRKNVWIKRGDFVLVEPIAEGDRVKAEIVSILYKDQIKYIQEEGKWPTAFGDCVRPATDAMISEDMLPPSDSSGDSDDDGDGGAHRVHNVNRQQWQQCDDDDTDDDSDDDGGGGIG